MIAKLLEAGIDVARLNFSHGTHEEHAQRIKTIREAARQAGRPIAILQDLQGPKIRTGELVDHKPVTLVPGSAFTITTQRVVGTAARVGTTYTALPTDVKPGDRILLSDGLIELRVRDVDHDDVNTEVVFGGDLRENQGINLPGVAVSAPALTPKDIADLEFGLEQDVDYIALSFVRRASDITSAKDRIKAAGKNIPVVAKIEKPEALDDIPAILEAADVIMVARGDLGVEMAAENIPVVQKQLIEEANRAGVPVITATQMLDSMIRNPRPTRAEASDVANAIIDGTDAVMLSGETANGSFPIESVKMMVRIAEVTEATGRRGDIIHPTHLVNPIQIATSKMTPHYDTADAISAASLAIVNILNVSAIVAFTMSGGTARAVARLRPDVPILAFTPSETVYRRLNLVWGITPIMCEFTEHLDDLQAIVERNVLKYGYAALNDTLVMTGGHPIAVEGSTNFLKVFQVGTPS
jgi:pyruvate kinase